MSEILLLPCLLGKSHDLAKPVALIPTLAMLALFQTGTETEKRPRELRIWSADCSSTVHIKLCSCPLDKMNLELNRHRCRTALHLHSMQSYRWCSGKRAREPHSVAIIAWHGMQLGCIAPHHPDGALRQKHPGRSKICAFLTALASRWSGKVRSTLLTMQTPFPLFQSAQSRLSPLSSHDEGQPSP